MHCMPKEHNKVSTDHATRTYGELAIYLIAILPKFNHFYLLGFAIMDWPFYRMLNVNSWCTLITLTVHLIQRSQLINPSSNAANLGDLEEMSPSPGRAPPMALYQEAIASNVSHYSNHHVYPYTFLAGYCYRNRLYKQALQAWAKAASVIK